jgi:cytoskeletal protein CcmA (bactofilin family)
MFSSKKQPPIKSLVGETSRIEGNYGFREGLRVDGTIVGNVSASLDVPSILVISETAAVHGEIHADHVILNGTVHSPVHARVMLELQPKARIHGDLYYTALEMHRGARVSGQLRPVVEEGEVVDEEKPTLKLAANHR